MWANTTTGNRRRFLSSIERIEMHIGKLFKEKEVKVQERTCGGCFNCPFYRYDSEYSFSTCGLDDRLGFKDSLRELKEEDGFDDECPLVNGGPIVVIPVSVSGFKLTAKKMPLINPGSE